MRMEIVRAENGYVVVFNDDPGSFGKRFIAADIAAVSEVVVSQLAAAELDRQEYRAIADKYGAVGGVAANIQKPLWQTPIHGAGARDDPLAQNSLNSQWASRLDAVTRGVPLVDIHHG